ncbi:hypothetical protein [Paenibacillus macquariensis]|uniref:Prolipoprotein diacylglyceryl transferase n=1 Tax=Paenibacillus macquariensis TaxID=948756 RepID=A0ABY1K7E6_9BACL|nr:hypothetical protein [Paenibacillus macquariensis]MEC0091066.1 hypothetical protein [Paenibacillus macquariensis]OAB33745.1 hypothetical protein PMSM_14085 [Paenibacillus macquariensis subsp. macquariensis]SIR36831.1 hypothetical protein SAMN05421578_11211 [Paenibacillus macquariensis]
MNVIQLGPLVLNLELLIFILSAFTGYLALKYRLKKARVTVEGNISDKFVNALILGFVIWKCSLILFDPMSVIKYPMSLIYFSGGDRGLALAIVISVIYLWIRTRKDGTDIILNLDVLLVGWMASSSMCHLLLLVLHKENVLYHALYISLNIVLVLYFYTRKVEAGDSSVLSRIMIWYSLVMIGISFIEKDRTLFVFGSTKEQIFYVIMFILVLWIDNVMDKQKRKESH